MNDPEPGTLFLGMGSAERRASIELKKGQKYNVQIRLQGALLSKGPFPNARAFSIGAFPRIDESKAIAEAVSLAETSDACILIVGINGDYESEGYDRPNMDLPGAQDKLVTAVLAANPNTVIVNQSGTPVSMPWADQASTIVQVMDWLLCTKHVLAEGFSGVLWRK